VALSTSLRQVQATVYRFDPDSGSGSVITDQGVVLPFELEALRLSGLRHLRPGQRLSVELAGPAGPAGPAEGRRIVSLTLGTIGATLREP
jgi:cold shock CspA family protein